MVLIIWQFFSTETITSSQITDAVAALLLYSHVSKYFKIHIIQFIIQFPRKGGLIEKAIETNAPFPPCTFFLSASLLLHCSKV